ncbi:fimbrial protein [Pseudomonas reactans]
MKNLVLVSSILAVASFSQLSQAKTGDINFTGNLTAATCDISGGGGGGTGNNIEVAMGTVSIRDIGTGVSGDFGAETGINLDIDCTGAGGFTNVVMNFAPRSGSGLDTDDSRLLKLAAAAGSTGASGVGIALINDSNQILDLGAAETVKGALDTSGTPATAKINLRAAYIKTTTPAAGIANATMPFTFSYE